MNFFNLLLLVGVMFYKSERGGDVMAHEGHEYLETVRAKDARHWRCRQYRKFKCPATARSRGNEIILANSKEHNHEGNPAQVMS